jgi:serine/threonine protein kinase
MLNAINEVHKYNIIHCDIKPQNFLLFYAEDGNTSLDTSIDSYDDSCILKLSDFGLAHRLENNRAYMRYKAGTFQYQALEIVDVNIF